MAEAVRDREDGAGDLDAGAAAGVFRAADRYASPASGIADYEGRIEYWDADTEIALDGARTDQRLPPNCRGSDWLA